MQSNITIPDWAHTFFEGIGICSFTCFMILLAMFLVGSIRSERQQNKGE